MATIIKSISFQNFYNYFGTFDENVFAFETGINIVSARNGKGKSNLYNGFLWVLTDQIYDSGEKRFMPVGSSFNRMASSKALSIGEPFDMAVEIEYTNGKDKYKVTKSVHFTKNGSDWEPSGQIVDIVETSHGVTTPIRDISLQNKIIEAIIPLPLRYYTLLQKESMEEIASKTGLKTAIETLTGIGDMVEVKADCSVLTRWANKLYNKQQAKATQQDLEGKKLLEEKKVLERRVDESNFNLCVVSRLLSEEKETKEQIDAIIENDSNGEKNRFGISTALANDNIARYSDEINKIKDNLERWEQRIAQIDNTLSMKNTGYFTKQYKEFRDAMACIERYLNNAKGCIYDKVLDELSKDANEKFRDLIKGSPVEDQTLTFEKQSDDTVHVLIRNAEGRKITGLDAGVQRMKQLSIIMAIITTKVGGNRFDYPVIFDAPFDMFSDTFIQNFFRMVPGLFTQSVIMLSDLYAVDDESNMNTSGKEIYNKMRTGKIHGSFYVTNSSFASKKWQCPSCQRSGLA